MSERAQRLSRRKFLLAVGAGGVGDRGGDRARRKPLPRQSGRKGKRATGGYHATEHIDNYYRTTKV